MSIRPCCVSAAALWVFAGSVIRADPPPGPFPAVLELSTVDGVIGFRVEGSDRQYSTGAAVSAAGDLNGDGIDDFVVNAPGARTPDGFASGRTYVIFGRDAATEPGFPAVLAPSSLDGITGFRIDGAAAGEGMGACPAPAGDVNGDGVDDLLIGASEAAPGGRSRAGITYVIFGRDTTTGASFPAVLPLSSLDGVDGFRLEGVKAGELSGASVSSAGDLNHDGHDDIIIGAYLVTIGARVYTGAAYVVFGRDTTTGPGFPAVMQLASLNGANGFRLEGQSREDYAGGAVASAGDVNGDGIDDVLVGATGVDGVSQAAGAAYVFFGRDTTTGPGFPASLPLSSLTGPNGFRIQGSGYYASTGGSVAGLGDVNGDGVSDVVVGAVSASYGLYQSGSAYVVFGRDTLAGPAFPAAIQVIDLDGTNGFRIDGAAEGDVMGPPVPAGDVNGDGMRDILLGADQADPGGRDRAGSAFVVYGREATSGLGFPAVIPLAGLDGVNGFRLNGVDPVDYCGMSIAGAGDVNGDGTSDLVIGAPLADIGDLFSAGEAYVVYGRRTPACSADLNGDGLVDFADYLEFLNLFEAEDPRADFNRDGVIDFADYLEFLNHFDAGC